ncbi:MAG: hypothetical protein IJP86_06800 [Synergistaceae bacterium]|nr:hypothetical protein [Synergistaceae bacterium]
MMNPASSTTRNYPSAITRKILNAVSAMSFYGAPGTGKTMAAEREDAVLFLDESDSLLSKRLTIVTQSDLVKASEKVKT